MTVFLLSLGGFPPTAGFIGKWYIFTAAVEAGPLLARDYRRPHQRRLGLLLPSHRSHDVHERGDGNPTAGRLSDRDGRTRLATLAVLYLGVLPTRVLDLARDSIATIF